MALQLGALLDALEDAGASKEKATKAAEELAGYEAQFSGVDTKLAGIDARLTMLTWTVGIQAGATLVILGSTFALRSKLGDISGQLAAIAHAATH